uniref:Mab-21-like HhH/H2TH-like domain-containing protein n=1 Tax=Clytia hemisphaerica TaxID=252671 RepID=A0A7M5UER4_9CNID
IEMEERRKEYAALNALVEIFDCEFKHLSTFLVDEESKDVIQHFDDQFPPSHLHFPIVIKAYVSGSVSENLNTYGSDSDYIYEIGPAVVRKKLNTYFGYFQKILWKTLNDEPGSIVDSRAKAFYYTKTKYDGFYQIEDNNGGFIYPVFLQRALYHILEINESDSKSNEIYFNFDKVGKGKASLREQAAKKLSVNTTGVPSPSIPSATKDKVIALRLKQWPTEIEQKLIDRNRNVENYTKIPLFLIPKSHPESQNPMVEWRLSFSLVEKEIFLNLPLLWRKAYLIMKNLFKKFHDEPFHPLNELNLKMSRKKVPQYYESPLKSYHIKTVLMWLYEEKPDFDERDIIGLLQLVVDGLLRAFSEMKLPNYFIPSQNVLNNPQKLDPFKIEKVKEILEKIKITDNLMNLSEIHPLESQLHGFQSEQEHQSFKATQMRDKFFRDNIP